MKKIAIIGSVGLPAKYGGWETLVDHLTKQLHSQFDITVYCTAKRYDEKLSSYHGAKLEYINLDANGIQSILYDLVSMIKALRKSNALLILGVSGCIFLPFLKLFSNKKFIVNIDGLEWKRDKWGGAAKAFLKLSEIAAVHFSDVVITDNKALQNYVWDRYAKHSELIAYGADHVSSEEINDDDCKKYPYLKDRYAFTVCRIEPENNISLILDAFASSKEMALVIVGNWDNSKYGKKLRLKYQHYKNIHLLDPIYEQSHLNKLRSNCCVYVHGHSAGGTNPSLVEAMHLSLPVIAFDVIYNRETTYNKAVYFKDKVQLIKILTQSDCFDWLRVSQEMKTISKNEYTWSAISKKYANLF